MNATDLARARFPNRRVTYSNEDFDAVQSIARTLTDADRAAGRPAPAFGYSGENYDAAERAVRAWLSSVWA